MQALPRVRLRHLKTRPQFQQLLALPPAARTSHFCLHRLTPDGSAEAEQTWLQAGRPDERVLWVGVLLPKRWARRAVTRNLIRRQAYAVALEHCQSGALGDAAQPPQQAVLIRLRSSFHAPRSPSPKRRRNDRPAPAEAQTAKAAPAPVPFKSAASDALRAEVRQQIKKLMARVWAAQTQTQLQTQP